jgi:ribosomal protein L11 methyltransferase
MTAPVLKEVAAQLTSGPTTLICSGLLPPELDEIATAFAPAGLREADRRIDGDWAALLLRRR